MDNNRVEPVGDYGVVTRRVLIIDHCCQTLI